MKSGWRSGCCKYIFYNKRGEVSAVVATMIVIMITLLIVVVLWMLLFSFFKTNVLDKTDCIYVDSSFSIIEGSKYTCHSDTLSKVHVRRKSSAGDIVEIQIIHELENGDTEIEKFHNIPKANNERVYEIEKYIDNVAVLSVINVSGKNASCNIMRKIKIENNC